MEIIKTLWNDSKLTHWLDGVRWLIYNFTGAFMPLWGGWVLLKLMSKSPTLNSFTEHGEFALYAASFSAASFYLILREIKSLSDFKRGSFPSRNSLGLIFFISMVISAFTFSAVYLSEIANADSNHQFRVNINKDFLNWTTIMLLSLTLFLSFIVVVTDNAYASVDVPEKANQDFKEFEKEFDKL